MCFVDGESLVMLAQAKSGYMLEKENYDQNWNNNVLGMHDGMFGNPAAEHMKPTKINAS